MEMGRECQVLELIEDGDLGDPRGVLAIRTQASAFRERVQERRQRSEAARSGIKHECGKEAHDA